MEYNFKEIENSWQAYWAKNKTFAAKDGGDKPKYYVLDMFPYPSGAGLHVGHPLGYIASDIVARYKRHKGFNVLHPMGYDSFGLPAEQYAIQTGQHPKITTENNIAVYRRQLDKIGFSFDWDREVRTSNPEYYKWTQWIFIQIFNSWYNKNSNKAENISTLISEFEVNGNTKVNTCSDENVKQFSATEWKAFTEKEQSDILMAYRIAYLGEAYVNWCPQLGTVLANDEIKDGVSERGGYPVERKLMKQWSMRISAYSQRLLDGLDTLDWTDSLKEAQRNWIGKSEGTSLKFKILTPIPSPKESGTTSHGYLTGDTEIIFELLKNAKANRKNFTETEDILWQELRNRKLESKFRRQHPIDKFIADFVCLEQKLIIEVDGEYHNTEEQKQLDDARTFILNYTGFKVIRFTNNEVKNELENVIERIKSELTTPPSPLETDRFDDTNSITTNHQSGLGGEDFIDVFTTRPDTVFGVSFVTLAPEHELVKSLTTADNKKAVEEYVTIAKNRSERERQADINKITGVFTGSYVEHPFTGKHIPIWIGDYVLAGYGTGAVMAVPAHDSRDYSFAKHFGLPILEVVQSPSPSERAGGEVYDAKEGKLINSDFLNGLDVKEAIKKAIAEIEAKGLGKGKVNFRLRDAVFGRQRYWGEPIPIYYKNDIPYALAENELPLVLPEVDKYLPTEDGEPPLARASSSWKHEGKYDYEHSTMPGWAGSSWYFLRYMDSTNGSVFADKKLADYWKQVDLYIGGSEHATGHLLYVRFWTKFLKDLGYIDIDEPAKKLINQGMIQGTSDKVYKITGGITTLFNSDGANAGLNFNFTDGKKVKIPFGYTEILLSNDLIKNINSIDIKAYATNVSIDLVEKNKLNLEEYSKWLPDNKTHILIFNESYFFNGEYYNFNGDKIAKPEVEGFMTFNEVEKMSKSKYNVVTPDDIAEKFGSDTLRLYEMFLGPLEQSKPWNTNGITGVHGFLKKLWRLFYPAVQGDASLLDSARSEKPTVTDAEPTKGELKTLHKTIKKITEDIERFSFNTSISNFMICVNELTDAKCNKKAILEPLLICLSPYAPHIAEELWKQLGHTESISTVAFPDFNEAYLVDDSINYPVSVNGKLKFTLELPATLSVQEVEAEVMKNENTIKLLEGKQPKKVIVVHKKIVNMVV